METSRIAYLLTKYHCLLLIFQFRPNGTSFQFCNNKCFLKILDTNGLIIHNVCLEETGKDLLYIIENETEPFGKPLEIKIPEDCRKTYALYI